MLNTGPLIAPVQPRLRKYTWLWITKKKTYNSFFPLLWVYYSTDRRRNRAFLKCFLPVERVVTSPGWEHRRLACISVAPGKKKSPNTKSVSMVITKIVSLSICTGTLPSRVGRTPREGRRGKGSLVFELRFGTAEYSLVTTWTFKTDKTSAEHSHCRLHNVNATGHELSPSRLSMCSIKTRSGSRDRAQHRKNWVKHSYFSFLSISEHLGRIFRHQWTGLFSQQVKVARIWFFSRHLNRCLEAQLSIYGFVFILTLTYGHVLWAVTEKDKKVDKSGRKRGSFWEWMGAACSFTDQISIGSNFALKEDIWSGSGIWSGYFWDDSPSTCSGPVRLGEGPGAGKQSWSEGGLQQLLPNLGWAKENGWMD